MPIATVGQVAEALAAIAIIYAPLVIGFVVLGRFARRAWRRDDVPQTVLARLTQLVLCGLAVLALPIAAVSVLAIGCPPHATECL